MGRLPLTQCNFFLLVEDWASGLLGPARASGDWSNFSWPLQKNMLSFTPQRMSELFLRACIYWVRENDVSLESPPYNFGGVTSCLANLDSWEV